MLAYGQSHLSKQISVKLRSKYKNFHTLKWVSNIVCKIAAILSWSQANQSLSQHFRPVKQNLETFLTVRWDKHLLNLCIGKGSNQLWPTFVLINNKWALVYIMNWYHTGDKPLPEPVMTQHICITRPQRVNEINLVQCMPSSIEKNCSKHVSTLVWFRWASCHNFPRDSGIYWKHQPLCVGALRTPCTSWRPKSHATCPHYQQSVW